MERESFEDEEVAALLNAHFIAIKVDREERPDIDAVYMAFCQSLTGAGGWPLTIFMTADKKPFFAGTYFPKHSAHGMAGLMELLTELSRLWAADRQRILLAGREITQSLSVQKQPPGCAPSARLLQRGAAVLSEHFDAQYGGFYAAPKFPAPHHLLFLMKYYEVHSDESLLHMVKITLDQMARGGIFDQLGGGFSRYSADRRWLVPHFEKMLYDNALLSTAYLEGYRLTGEDYYRTVARRTLGYIQRELTDPAGGFYCGQDADSEGTEGKYYVFTPEEIHTVLGSRDASVYCSGYDITPQGNFEGKSIPNLLKNPSYRDMDRSVTADMSQKLYRYRLSRTSLHLDDKILTSWNALAIVAFSRAARLFADTAYLESAQRAADFLKSHLTARGGRLHIRYRDGEAAFSGCLDDYAYLIWALLELYAADLQVQHLVWAVQLAQTMTELFMDRQNGGFYLYASDAEPLPTRPVEIYDGALPSGNSVAALTLNRLGALTGDPGLLEAARLQSSFLAGSIGGFPASHSFSLYALTELLYPPCHLVCALSENRLPPEAAEAAGRYPVTVLAKTPESAQELVRLAPYTKDMKIPSAGIRYYLCREGACYPPAEDLQTVLRNLDL